MDTVKRDLHQLHNMKNQIALLFILLSHHFLFSQIQKERKMHRVISTPTGNELAPSLTPDGKTMIFMKKTTSSKDYHIHITTKKQGQWSRPTEIQILNKHSTMLMIGGYSIAPDGNEIIYTTKKHPSIGGYDLWSSKKIKDKWSEPSNLGKPLNTKNNEGMPSFSADGESLFFIRGHLHHQRVSGKIYVSKKGKNSWLTPELIKTPDKISQVHQTAGKTHLLLNNTKEIFYFDRKNETKSSAVLTEPNTFFSIDYKHNMITYSKEVNGLFDIFNGIIVENNNTPKPTVQYKIISEQPLLITVYTKDNVIKSKTKIKSDEVKTLFFVEATNIAFQNKALHFKTKKINVEKSKTEYTKISTLKSPIPLSNNDVTFFTLLDIKLLKQYLNSKQLNKLKVEYTCPEKITVDENNYSASENNEKEIKMDCETAIKKNTFFNYFSDITLDFHESDKNSKTPKWIIQY